MIRLTRINRVPLVLNADLIEHVEVTPDTVISLTTGQKFVVLETPEEVIERVIEYRRAINERAGGPAAGASDRGEKKGVDSV
ncbi:MAG TPA: endoflagellar protein [Bryobacterales bacterium]|nr:endoflagellar protein [Bryobacterales bacterium]